MPPFVQSNQYREWYKNCATLISVSIQWFAVMLIVAEKAEECDANEAT